jgi:hypothetical protein
MGLYVYCVVPRTHEPAATRGIDDAAVDMFGWKDLGCWVSELPQRPEPAVDRIRAHNQVVQAAVTTSITPVPVRFGQWLETSAALETHVELNAERYRTLLELFGGALEFGLRVLDPERTSAQVLPPQQAGSGRDYLTALRDQFRNAELDEPRVAALRSQLQIEFDGLARAERFEPLRTTHGLLSVAHLVDQKVIEAYRERVRQLREQWPQLRILASGPWPPYSFAV